MAQLHCELFDIKWRGIMIFSHYHRLTEAKMMIIFRPLLSALLLFMAIFAQPASAVVVKMDFENFGNHDSHKNLHMRGFVLSVRCHYHLTSDSLGVPSPTGHSITFDNSGCYDSSPQGYNKEYLGPTPPWQEGIWFPSFMYVARASGNAFSLNSFIFTAGSDGGGYWLTSSRGGAIYAEYSTDLYRTLSFDGPDWTDVDWLLFSNVGGDHPIGFDDLTLEFNAVPEPVTMWLFLLALVPLLSQRHLRVMQ